MVEWSLSVPMGRSMSLSIATWSVAAVRQPQRPANAHIFAHLNVRHLCQSTSPQVAHVKIPKSNNNGSVYGVELTASHGGFDMRGAVAISRLDCALNWPSLGKILIRVLVGCSSPKARSIFLFHI